MPYRIIGSPDPKYLAATDILVGDMSDTNYEFLLYNRPIILLANDWMRKNFPGIGIRTDLNGLKSAIKRSMAHPEEFEKKREYYLAKAIEKPDGRASERIIKIVLEKSGISHPIFYFLDGGDQVLRSNLSPLEEEVKKRGYECHRMARLKESDDKNNIFISAHFENLHIKGSGFRVHFDHGLKGQGTANVEMSRRDYEKNQFFPYIDLHITAGEMGHERTTQILLGPNAGRAFMAGYPKADHLMNLNTKENKNAVMKEFGFDISKPLITYAPSGKKSYEKPGGSFSPEALDEFTRIARTENLNILIKLKSYTPSLKIHAFFAPYPIPKPSHIMKAVHFINMVRKFMKF